MITKNRTIAIPATAIIAIALTACGAESDDKSYEVGGEDVGGGELQVADPQPGEIEGDLPETPMKNVPAEDTVDAPDAKSAAN